MILDYEPGDKVTNPNNKEWGIGQVQSIINSKVTINFENVGKKVINADIIKVEKIKDEHWRKKKITLSLLDTFNEGGQIALSLRSAGLKKEIKSDNTPVSNGDLEVNNILTKKISEVTPNIIIVSEENSAHKNDQDLKNFWLIDPIDGTKDYINNGDEFTINAALILNKKPVIGIISAPAKKRLFYSYGMSNSYELINNQEVNLINKKKNYIEIKAVSYSSLLKPDILEIHKRYKVASHLKMKSSLKFCVVAAGEFDLYVAEPRACEWDIAAGHALVIHAGGIVTDFNNNEIYYGKPNFNNSSIIVKNKNII